MTKTLDYRNGLWLGTKQYISFVPAPRRGATVQAQGWSEEGNGKNGGGYIVESFGRHKTFQYDWGASTDRQYATYLQGLKDGVYGRGVIHFTDPTCYATNVLAPHWANPGMTLDFEAPPLVFRRDPEIFEFGRSDRPNTPLNGAIYSGLPTSLNTADCLYIPIPPGMSLLMGSRYISDHSTAGVYVQPVNKNFGLSSGSRVMLPRGINENNPFQNLVTNRFHSTNWAGVYIWIGRGSGSTSAHTVSILDMIGKLVPTHKVASNLSTMYQDDVWYIGEGHTGVRFLGQPTIEYHSNRNTSISLTFKEVGAWELASRL